MRSNLSGLAVFLEVARLGSLTRAASALGITTPSVSYQLKMLESEVGTPLLVRTTRSVALTDAGRILVDRAIPALSELRDAFHAARNVSQTVKGSIRLTLPHIAYMMSIGKRIAAFQATFPDVELELSFNDALVDIVSEGFHAGIRLGENIDDDMIAVRLCPPFREVLFGTPAYFDCHGRPQTPNDLLKHNFVRYRYISSGRIAPWRYRTGEGTRTLDIVGNLVVNNTASLIHAVTEGVGLAWLFEPAIEKELRDGVLETVLDTYTLEHAGYYLFFPRSSSKLSAFRAFVDFMKQQDPK